MDTPEVPRPSGPADPARIRIGDQERHQTAEVLRRAAGEGRLDLDELDERLEATYAAKVHGDLVPILEDLPDTVPAVPGEFAAAQVPAAQSESQVAYGRSVAVMGGVARTGVWQIGETHTAFCWMGGADLDLREAVFSAPETVITATAIMGGIVIVVNAHTKVIVDGIGFMGDFSQGRDRVTPQLDDSSPVVRIKGLAFMGEVSVVRRGPSSRGRSRKERREDRLPPPHLRHR